MFGPLGQGDPDRKAKEVQIEQDVAQASSLLNTLESSSMKELSEKYGGSWQPLTKEAADTAAAKP